MGGGVGMEIRMGVELKGTSEFFPSCHQHFFDRMHEKH